VCAPNTVTFYRSARPDSFPDYFDRKSAHLVYQVHALKSVICAPPPGNDDALAQVSDIDYVSVPAVQEFVEVELYDSGLGWIWNFPEGCRANENYR